MLQTPTSLQGDVVIVTLDYRENGPVLERQHDLEMSLFKGVSDPFLYETPTENPNSFTNFKDFINSVEQSKMAAFDHPYSQPSFSCLASLAQTNKKGTNLR